MLRLFPDLATALDLRIAALAVVLCLIASYTAANLIGRARNTQGRVAWAWTGAAAAAAAIGIWSVHFTLMLAYTREHPLAYDFILVLASAVVAFLAAGAAIVLHLRGHCKLRTLVTGVLFGLGVGLVHGLATRALVLPGRLAYDPIPAVTALMIGVGFSTLALKALDGRRSLFCRAVGPIFLTLAIASVHIAGFAAVRFIPDPTVALPIMVIPGIWIAAMVALAALALLAHTLVAAMFDNYIARRSGAEARRLRDLVDATTEAIVICDDDIIIDANRRFAAMAAADIADLYGHSIVDLIGSRVYDLAKRRAGPNNQTMTEGRFMRLDGASIPIELLMRTADMGNARRQLFAIRDISERKHAQAHMQHLSQHDSLTDLPNRALFNDRLAHELGRAHRKSEPVAVLCLDLDRFKQINDLFGHEAGDTLLQQVADRLRACVGPDDSIARLGSDEFSIIQLGARQPDSAHDLGQKLIKAMDEKFILLGKEAVVGISIGIAVYPMDGADPRSLLRNADTALERAKQGGRGALRFFEATMDDEARARRMLEIDLCLALERNEMELHYQPQARTRDCRVTGFEALLRWKHHEYGNVPPTIFIPMAEECGFIWTLGAWVLREACREAASWSEPLRIGVNLSPAQFAQGDLTMLVAQILDETGLAPDRLELEITEGVLMKDKDGALELLKNLKAMGIRIAMDDFGTGYSSLSYLQSFPFDKIKIDRSFIMNLDQNAESIAIVRAVVGLGRGLGMPVIAEGVETETQLNMLRSADCDEIQGYLISRPQPIKAFADLVHPVLRRNLSA